MTMENNEGGKSEGLSPQEETAKAAILAECDKFAKAGVTFVAAHFDGYGDRGTTEGRGFYGELYAGGEDQTVNHDVSYLQDHFEVLVPFGYENDCGGFGDIVLDVNA